MYPLIPEALLVGGPAPCAQVIAFASKPRRMKAARTARRFLLDGLEKNTRDPSPHRGQSVLEASRQLDAAGSRLELAASSTAEPHLFVLQHGGVIRTHELTCAGRGLQNGPFVRELEADVQPRQGRNGALVGTESRCSVPLKSNAQVSLLHAHETAILESERAVEPAGLVPEDAVQCTEGTLVVLIFVECECEPDPGLVAGHEAERCRCEFTSARMIVTVFRNTSFEELETRIDTRNPVHRLELPRHFYSPRALVLNADIAIQ